MPRGVNRHGLIEQKDHTAPGLKIALRRQALAWLGGRTAALLETHAGGGELWRLCYKDCASGLAIERDPARCRFLERARGRTWEIVCGAAEDAVALPRIRQRAWTLLDVDPYTSPWPTLDAFFRRGQVWAPGMAVVVTDSGRQGVRYDNGRRIQGLQPYVARYGRHLHQLYLQVCRDRLEALVAPHGYHITAWRGAYGGRILTMTYWACLLTRPSAGDG